MALQWQIRRDTAAQWTANNPILAEGEFGVETDSLNTNSLMIKIGNGTSAWNDLVYTLQGLQGEAGQDGADGDSAYEIAVANGFVGTEQEWLDSLQGEQGEQGEAAPQIKVATFLATQGQTTFTVPENVIVDDPNYSVNVNGLGWNSRTGTISFPLGNVSINFATGVITFLVPLDVNDQVIIKYN